VYESYGRKGFMEYAFSFVDGQIRESNRGKTGVAVRDPTRIPVLGTERFAQAYNTERFYWGSMKDKLEATFSQGNMEYFDHLLKGLDRGNEEWCRRTYPLAGTVGKVRFERKHLQHLLPNRQFTKVVFQSVDVMEPKGLMIDVLKKEISFPFGKDLLYQCEWDERGSNIAYVSAKKSLGDHSILVVKDLSKRETLFSLDLNNESIMDITWDQTGQYIAILSVIYASSHNPVDLLITFSGHPVGYRTYYLELYDRKGSLLYRSKDTDIGRFSAGRGSGRGSIVWMHREDQ
jgi:hypothetical protein